MKNMNHLVSLLQEGYTTVKVEFGSIGQIPPIDYVLDEPWNGAQAHQQPARATQQRYTYKCFFDCKVGDVVVVPPTGKGLGLATVVAVDPEPDLNFEGDIEYKWLIAKVDFTQYINVQGKETALIRGLRDVERQKERQALLDHYQLALPQEGEARKLIDEARQIGGAKPE